LVGSSKAIAIRDVWRPFFDDGGDPEATEEARRSGRLVYRIRTMTRAEIEALQMVFAQNKKSDEEEDVTIA
jgi:hypothetical protein